LNGKSKYRREVYERNPRTAQMEEIRILNTEWELLPSLCALIKEFFTFFRKLNFSFHRIGKPQTVWFPDPLKVRDLLSISLRIKK
jgi:hypothetical protein